MEHLVYDIRCGDFTSAGAASRDLKHHLKRIGAESDAVRRAMIAAYEAEMNVVIHAEGGGRLDAAVSDGQLDVDVVDRGPGIADVDAAMREGWSTASAEARALGFGAGMGLPNILRNSDRLAVTSAPGEGFDYPAGTLVTGKMVAALRRLGFDAVFDTDFTADLTITEEGTELLMRLRKALVDGDDVALPQFSSCSPGWINYMEHFNPEMLANLSTCKSPQQMFGAVAKTYYAEKIGVRPEDMVVVSVMPCTAKKYEAARPEMNDNGVQDVDIVLTTRELGALIKQAGIDFRGLPDEQMDAPLGISTGGADIFANTGGVMEAALRTAWAIVTGSKPFPFPDLHVKPIEGLEGVKTATVKVEGAVDDWAFLEGADLRVAVAHGLGNAQRVIDQIRNGEAEYHFVEVMTCPGGYIGGGGQPRPTTNEVRMKRIEAIYREDEGREHRQSHENPAVCALYEEYLGAPCGEISHHLLHTHYFELDRV